jgi:two-component system, NarL family, response regulator DevR
MLRADPRQGEAGQAPLRLALVDDHEVFRLGLRSLLTRVQGVEVAWDTGSAHDAFDLCRRDPVQAVLMDINLGGPVDGLQATRRLTSAWPELKVILISGLADERRLALAREVGAAGFLPKELGADDMVRAIQRMVARSSTAGGANWTSAGQSRVPSRAGAAALQALSPREVEVLAEVRHARTNREIAQRLGVSTTTVNKHVHQILRKLGVRNRAEAAIVAGRLLSQPREPI